MPASGSIALVFIAIQLLAACASAPYTRDAAPSTDRPSAPVSLAIDGFNYTDLPIDLFSVNSNGGGNIFVSSPSSGGGGSTCCFRLYPDATLPRNVTVEWMRDFGRHRRWCSKTVQLNGPLPAEPTDVGVHFMPDGDIQIEVSHGYPAVKLTLPRVDASRRRRADNIIHDEETASCRDAP